MNHAEVLDTLHGVRFLHDIGDDYLEALAGLAQVVEFPPGLVIFREGQSHGRIYLVIEGSVALEVRVSGREVKRLQTIGAGELLGWSPLLAQVEMTATARSLAPTRAVAIDATQLLALCEHNPKFGFEFMRRTARALAKRLAATRLQLLDIYDHQIPAIPGAEGS